MNKKLLVLLTAAYITLFSLNLSAQEIMTSEKAGAFLYSKGLIQGDNGDLMLEQFLTREQTIVLMSRFIGAEETAKNFHVDNMTFKDVPEDHWAAPYIAWAQANRLTNGYSPDMFGLGHYATGWQTKAFFVKALGFTSVSDELMEAKAEQLGITLNIDVVPSDPILRGQMSVLLFNTLNSINNEGELFGERLGIITPKNKLSVRDGEWIYYADSSDENKLYKMDISGNNSTKLSDDAIGGIYVDGNWIYYFNNSDEGKFYRINKSGALGSKIVDGIIHSPVISKGWIYYANINDGSLLYKVKTDGKENTKLTEDNCDGISIFEDWVYYINFRDNASLYKVKNDGTGRTKVGVNKRLVLNQFGSSFDGLNSNSIDIGEWTYYSNPYDNYHLYKINYSRTEFFKLNEAYSKNIYNVGEWIYYENYSDQSKIYKIKLDGTENTKVSDERVNILDINQSGIYFKSLTDSKLYKMSIDGTDIKLIANDIVIDAKVNDDWVYYVNYSDSAKIYKIKTNGTNKVKVVNSSSFGLHLINNSLYFSNVKDEYKLFRLNLDNSELERLTHEGTLIIKEAQGHVYYYSLLDNDNIYKIQIDGTNRAVVEQ